MHSTKNYQIHWPKNKATDQILVLACATTIQFIALLRGASKVQHPQYLSQ